MRKHYFFFLAFCCHPSTAMSLPFTSIILLPSIIFPIYAFSAFSRFQFAPNGVCLKPRYFLDATTSTRFTMKNVPGEGNCIFLAVTLASLHSVGLGTNDALLNSMSRETRQVVANVLSRKSGTLVTMEGKRLVSTASLLKSAANTEGVSTDEYIQMLRDGSLHGGEVELTVLSNILRRPISIYELQQTTPFLHSNGDSVVPLYCRGTFGSHLFQDPLRNVHNSAVAWYHEWNLHILVMDVSQQEKRVCVLLPQKWHRIV